MKSATGSSALKTWRALLIVVGVLPALAQPAEAQEPFFKDKTIRVIVGSAPGGGYDAYARLVSDHMRRHIPGNPQIVVQNMPGAGSLVAMNHIANVAPRDGMVLGAVNAAMTTLPLLKPDQAKFDPRKMNWIGSTLREFHIGLVRSDSPVKVMADTQKTEIPVAGTGGSTSTYPVITNAILNTKFKVVHGYQGTAQGMLAMERGEVDGVIGITWASIKATQAAALRDGKLQVLAQFALRKHPELPNVPLVLELAKTPEDQAAMRLVFSAQEVGRPWVVPEGVPAQTVAILRKAFDDTMADAEFRADAAKRKLDLDPTRGVEIQAVVEDIFKTPASVVDRIKPFLEGGQ
ncbi:MAG TPA: tripartite tricarboxylate transporter substrate-binding protein [Xanthobacteraceae bacterium]|nr:tripartite tricarboxylate transporter substrate-binding protein [Xanthobacteraceae bacterium]